MPIEEVAGIRQNEKASWQTCRGKQRTQRKGTFNFFM